jgi:long-chain acyl-CoA synthetase
MYNISKIISDTAKFKGNNDAFNFNSKSYTFNDLLILSQVNKIKIQKYTKGSIGIYCYSSKNFIISLYACLFSGSKPFLISGNIKEFEVESLCEQFDICTLITDISHNHLQNINKINPTTEVDYGYPVDYENYVNIKSNDIAFYLMTSGTTGKRRSVPITQKNLIWTGKKFNDFMGISENEKELVLVPLTHSFGVRRIVAQLLLGGCVFSLDGMFNPAEALICIKNNDCTVLSLVPSQVRIFQQYFYDEFESIGRSIRFIELSSEYMSPSEKEYLMQIMPNAQIIMGYGLTEATRSALLHFQKNLNKINTSGKPIDGVEILIIDGDGINNEGKIAIRGPNVVSYYVGDNIAENNNFINDYFLTGDYGHIDNDGFLTVIGRVDDMINVGGNKFNPIEIESSLREEFPGIDCAIDYIPDKILGSRPVLCIGSKKKFNYDSILNYIGDSFEFFKHPCKVFFLDEIYRTENGKIRRSNLHEDILKINSKE